MDGDQSALDLFSPLMDAGSASEAQEIRELMEEKMVFNSFFILMARRFLYLTRARFDGLRLKSSSDTNVAQRRLSMDNTQPRA